MSLFQPVVALLLLLTSCQPHREGSSVLSNISACQGGGARFLPRVRAFFEKHGIAHAGDWYGEARGGNYAVEGHRAAARFYVSFIEPYGTTALFLDEGDQPTERDAQLYRELAGVFRECEPTQVNGQFVGRAAERKVPVVEVVPRER